MYSTECLEILFTSQPATVTSTIFVDGRRIAQGTFRDQHHIKTWTSTLDDIAEATRNSQKAKLNLRPGETAQLTGFISSNAVSSPAYQPSEHLDGQSTRDNLLSASSKPSCSREIAFLAVNQSSDVLAATSAHQIAPTRLSARTDIVDPPNTISPQWSAVVENDAPLTIIPMNTSKDTEIESASALISLFSTISAPAREGCVSTHSSISPNSPLRGDVLIDVALVSSNSNQSMAIKKAVSSSVSSVSSTMSTDVGEQTPGAKRSKKLDLLLERIRDQTNPNQIEHNEKIDNLCNSTISPTSIATTTVQEFGHLLGDLGHVSNVLGFIYGLLSWEVFRREEGRLIREEGQSARWAAKRMNDEMTKQSDRHASTKDWASDGRRAAGMVFGSIADLDPATKSLALFLLADLAILDNLIKIAHFPLLRERFARVFREIQKSREDRGDKLVEETRYRVFDYEECLRTRRWPTNSSIDPLAWHSRFWENENSPSPGHQMGSPLSDGGNRSLDTDDESSRKRRRVSQLCTTRSAKPMSFTSVDTKKNEIDRRMDTVPTVLNSVPIAAKTTNRTDLAIGAEAHETSSAFHGQLGNIDSPQTQDYNILFGPPHDFDATFQ